MKRVLSGLVVICIFLLSLAGCTPRVTDLAGDPDPTGTAAPTGAPTQTPTAAPSDPPPPEREASPLIWKVTGEGTGALYLFGTIHVGDPRVGGVIDTVAPILAECDALAVEFDSVAYEKDTAAVTRDIMQFVYQDGTTARDHMPEKLYKAAAAMLDRAGISTAFLDLYSLPLWDMYVEQAMMQVYSDLLYDWGVDGLLIRRAYELDKPVWDVESAAFQYGLMNEFSDELYCLLMRETLKMGKEYGEQLDDLYEAWLTGDLTALIEMVTGEEDLEELTERQIALITEYNRAMLDDRNLGMAEKAKGYLQEGKTVFFAVGTAHMLGEAGLVRLLEDAGYTAEVYPY